MLFSKQVGRWDKKTKNSMRPLTSVVRRWSGPGQGPGSRPLARAGGSVQPGRLGEGGQHLPSQQSQVVLGEGAVSLQRRGGALCPPQLATFRRLLLLPAGCEVVKEDVENEEKSKRHREGGRVGEEEWSVKFGYQEDGGMNSSGLLLLLLFMNCQEIPGQH